ncbi:MAG: alpha/beta hydrolase [Mariniblastus sp.]|nr:alpha/beta hydrolase [Mariniblastus sp.]
MRIGILGFLFLMFGVFCDYSVSAEPEVIPLWASNVPGAMGNEEKDTPRLILYPATENPSGTAVVICPGGGYGGLAMGHEGHQIAAWLNKNGISAFICDYRHRGKGYGHPYPLMDVQRAIRTVRKNAEAWKINPDKIGVLGFSAGGHLASSVSTHDSLGDLLGDEIDAMPCRPNFSVLCYPVIGFGKPYTHRGSQRNLIGDNAKQELIQFYSNEEQVDSKTPPTFLWHTTQDKAVPVENSIEYYLACKKHQVPASLHIFEQGRHGIGLAVGTKAAFAWPQLCIEWMQELGFADATSPK